MNTAAELRRLRVGVAATILWIVAAIAIGSALLIGRPPVGSAPVLAVLFLLAVLAELSPVQFKREGVMLCFTLPFVIGALVVAGPLGALATELGSNLIASIIRSMRKSQRRVWFWARVNLPIGALSASIASLAYLSAAGPEYANVYAGVAAAIPTYLLVNTLLVSRLNSLIGAKSFGEEVRNALPAVVVGLLLYGLVALVVAALLKEQAYYALPIVVFPLAMMREIVIRHNAADDMAYETMVALTIMLQRAHPYTHGHLERVGRIAEEVGIRLGIPKRRARLLREAAVLHDIGKIAIDEEVLDKPAKLTEEEYEHVKLHSQFGAQIVKDSARFQSLATWILYHHERPDGRGYPHQLSDVEIPIESKIIAVADAFDAMAGGAASSEKRNYRPPMDPEDAMKELERCQSTQFDPKVVGAFREVLTAQGVLR